MKKILLFLIILALTIFATGCSVSSSPQFYLSIVAVIIIVLPAFLITLYLLNKNQRLSKKLENQQAQLQELLKDSMEESRQKTLFFSKMSHCIRTPMNSIIGFSELVLDKRIPQSDKEAYLHKITQNSWELMNIVNNAMDVALFEAGELKLESVPFTLNDVYDTCQSIILPKTLEKGITLHFGVETLAGSKLLGDPAKLRQLLLNLLLNAVKFTNTGTVKLLVSVENKTENTVKLRFDVDDSGIGISPEKLSKINKTFSQMGNSSKRMYDETGLSLIITKALIEMMGGKLTAESEPGKGSKFNFALEFEIVNTITHEITEDVEDKANENESPNFSGEILLCEDSVVNQHIIKKHFSRLGFNTVIASNGKEGVDIVSDRVRNGVKLFDLIFMDIHMPVMDGLEAADVIAALGVKTPIIALSTDAKDKDMELYNSHGIYDLLNKPFTGNELWTCLYKYLKPLGYTAVNEPDSADSEQKRKPEAVEPEAADKNEMQELFKSLELLLLADSAACLGLVDELRAIPRTETLIYQIEDYEFEAALEELAELKRTLGGQ